MAYLTDGFVPEWWVKDQPRGLVKAKRLVSAELWRYPAEKDGEQGFQFHDWKHECTKAVVLANREKARQRKAKQRESQQESRRDTPRDGLRESHEMSGPTQPNPTQPINTLVDLGGGVTQVAASDPPPQFCPKHPEGTDKPCWACKSYREAFEAWEVLAAAEARHTQAEARDSAIRRCGRCDEFGRIEIDDEGTLARCSHQEAVNA